MFTTKSEIVYGEKIVEKHDRNYVKLMTAVWVHDYEEKLVRTMDMICFKIKFEGLNPFYSILPLLKSITIYIVSIVSRYVSDRLILRTVSSQF
jgi:hypothetical protein